MSGWDIKADYADVIAEWGGALPSNSTQVEENLDAWGDWGGGEKSSTHTSSRNYDNQSRGRNESQNRDYQNDWDSRGRSQDDRSHRTSSSHRNRDYQDDWNSQGRSRDDHSHRTSSSRQNRDYQDDWNSRGQSRDDHSHRTSSSQKHLYRSDSKRSQDQPSNNKSELSREVQHNSVTIRIQSSEIGKIIGRGGCKIKELQEKSGAYIKVLNLANKFYLHRVLIICSLHLLSDPP